MTLQEMFDKAYIRLHNGTGRAGAFNANRQFVCQYRTTSNTKCVVGIFISDEAYHPSMENKMLSTLLRAKDRFPNLTNNWPYHAGDLLAELQLIHDNCDNWNANELTETAERRLKTIAHTFYLEFPASNNSNL